MLNRAIRPGVNQYYSGDKAVTAYLYKLLCNYRNPVVITGKKSRAAFEDYQYAEKSIFNLPLFYYDGTASKENAQYLAYQLKGYDVDLLLAVGGGALLDTVKLVAELLNKPFACIPTLLSNCAATTSLAVTYTQDTHQCQGFDILKRAADFVIVDYGLLLRSHRDYFVAGIGDTYAKYYEARGIIDQLDQELDVFANTGFAVSQLIYQTLKADSVTALHAFEAGVISPALRRIADCVIGLAGSVGGFANEYGRVAGAHAIHNGMTSLPETQPILHGKKVAYGILVQLVIEGRLAELVSLKAHFSDLHLPTSLSDLNLGLRDHDKLMQLAIHATSSTETFRFIKPKIQPEEVLNAIKEIEKR